MSNESIPSRQRKKEDGRFLPALCSFLGTLILLAVIAASIPLTIPRFLGYEIYSVVSGSMEPEIPVGSVLYVSPAEPETVEEGQVIAFRSGDSVVTHRVVRNQFAEGEFVTKGDANNTEDINSVPYRDLIGIVRYHFPMAGRLLMIYSSQAGKLYVLCLAACGVMFNILAGRLRERSRGRDRKEPEASEAKHLTETALEPSRQERRNAREQARKERRRRRVRRILMVILLLIFLTSTGVVVVVKRQYRLEDEFYRDSASRFTAAATPIPLANGEGPAIPGNEGEGLKLPSENTEADGETAPFRVDFQALQALNSDVIGWIYCPGTPIDYPILQGEDNDAYLHHSYDKQYRAAGSIFEECANRRGFVDSNVILYGHHMSNGSMFACLEKWTDQSFYEEHPVLWILTPEQDYKVVLFSAYTTSAYSDSYTVYTGPGQAFDEYLQKAQGSSAVRTEVDLDPDAHYVMLSTCSYLFDDARSIVHGMMVPVERRAS